MPWSYAVLAVLSDSCPPPKGRLPTCYSPVRHSTNPKVFAFDLHVLGPPLTFALSQDQTLQLITESVCPDPHRFIVLGWVEDDPVQPERNPTSVVALSYWTFVLIGYPRR